MPAEIRVIGISAAVDNLREMGRRIQTRVTRKAVRAATRLIAKAVKAGTYAGDRTQRTGLLLRSQGYSVSSRGDRIVGKIVMRPVPITGQTKVAQLVRRKRASRIAPTQTTSTAFYWRFLERGTVKRQTASGANRGSVSPRPWVEPTFDTHDGAAIDAFAETFNREVEAEALQLPNTARRP